MARSAVMRLSSARTGVAMLFVANALVFASIVTRYPELKAAFGLGDLAFGVMVACGPVGSVLGSVAGGWLVNRRGAVPVAVSSTLVLGALVAAAGVVDSPVFFAGVLFAIGFADATGDVGNNAHGLTMQRLMGRSIINGLHGAWSAGAIAGAAAGALALQLGIPIAMHLPVIGGLIIVGTPVAARLVRLPAAQAPAAQAPAAAPSARRRGPLPAAVIAASALIALGAFLEDIGSTWGGVYAVTETGANLAESAIPFAVLMTALTVGRFVSDALVDRLGKARTLRIATVAALVGLLVVVLAPQTWVVAVGLGILGLGIAPMIPLAMDAAERAPGVAAGTGLAAVGTVMRVGFLASPLLLGAVAEWAGLRTAIALCLLAPIAALILVSRVRAPRS